jgi:hypothetical protein
VAVNSDELQGSELTSHVRNYAYLLKKIYILVDTLKWQQVPAIVVLPYFYILFGLYLLMA